MLKVARFIGLGALLIIALAGVLSVRGRGWVRYRIGVVSSLDETTLEDV